jgi:hypothetical protein
MSRPGRELRHNHHPTPPPVPVAQGRNLSRPGREPLRFFSSVCVIPNEERDLLFVLSFPSARHLLKVRPPKGPT